MSTGERAGGLDRIEPGGRYFVQPQLEAEAVTDASHEDGGEPEVQAVEGFVEPVVAEEAVYEPAAVEEAVADEEATAEPVAVEEAVAEETVAEPVVVDEAVADEAVAEEVASEEAEAELVTTDEDGHVLDAPFVRSADDTVELERLPESESDIHADLDDVDFRVVDAEEEAVEEAAEQDDTDAQAEFERRVDDEADLWEANRRNKRRWAIGSLIGATVLAGGVAVALAWDGVHNWFMMHGHDVLGILGNKQAVHPSVSGIEPTTISVAPPAVVGEVAGTVSAATPLDLGGLDLSTALPYQVAERVADLQGVDPMTSLQTYAEAAGYHMQQVGDTVQIYTGSANNDGHALDGAGQASFILDYLNHVQAALGATGR